MYVFSAPENRNIPTPLLISPYNLTKSVAVPGPDLAGPFGTAFWSVFPVKIPKQKMTYQYK
jgi:hypothetical protein